MIILTSCKEEKIVTDGEQIGIEIAQFVKDNSVAKANVEVNSQTTEFVVGFKISGRFLIVNNTHYNLEKLIYFGLINYDGMKVIVLRFNS